MADPAVADFIDPPRSGWKELLTVTLKEYVEKGKGRLAAARVAEARA